VKTSVLTITYNHEAYIAQALDSALMQRTREPFEIVVGEDGSSDRTREILLAYREKHPETIRLLLHDRNVGMNRNLAQTLSACRGEYVAILEGDDYWTSPEKLQRQADFLDSHPECAAVFHNVDMADGTGERTGRRFHREGLPKSVYTLEDVVSSHFIPTCTTMFRRGLFGEFPEWFYAMPMGDWPLHVLNAQHGSYGYMDEVMACYRVHGEGVWSGRGRAEILLSTARAAEEINRHLGFGFDAILRQRIAAWRREATLRLRCEERDFLGAARCLAEFAIERPLLGRPFRDAVRIFLRSAFRHP